MRIDEYAKLKNLTPRVVRSMIDRGELLAKKIHDPQNNRQRWDVDYPPKGKKKARKLAKKITPSDEITDETLLEMAASDEDPAAASRITVARLKMAQTVSALVTVDAKKLDNKRKELEIRKLAGELVDAKEVEGVIRDILNAVKLAFVSSPMEIIKMARKKNVKMSSEDLETLKTILTRQSNASIRSLQDRFSPKNLK